MAKLNAAARNDLPKGDFVEPGKKAYPIPDAAHARNALARSSGKAVAAKVKEAVKEKFPNIVQNKGAGSSKQRGSSDGFMRRSK